MQRNTPVVSARRWERRPDPDEASWFATNYAHVIPARLEVGEVGGDAPGAQRVFAEIEEQARRQCPATRPTVGRDAPNTDSLESLLASAPRRAPRWAPVWDAGVDLEPAARRPERNHDDSGFTASLADTLATAPPRRRDTTSPPSPPPPQPRSNVTRPDEHTESLAELLASGRRAREPRRQSNELPESQEAPGPSIVTRLDRARQEAAMAFEAQGLGEILARPRVAERERREAQSPPAEAARARPPAASADGFNGDLASVLASSRRRHWRDETTAEESEATAAVRRRPGRNGAVVRPEDAGFQGSLSASLGGPRARQSGLQPAARRTAAARREEAIQEEQIQQQNADRATARRRLALELRREQQRHAARQHAGDPEEQPIGRHASGAEIGRPWWAAEPILREDQLEYSQLLQLDEAVRPKPIGVNQRLLTSKTKLVKWGPGAARADPEASCSICCEAFDVGTVRIRKLPCKHFFHDACIKPWFKTHTACPNCRRDLCDD